MESYKFIPNFATKLSKYDGVNVIVQLALENTPKCVVNSIEIGGSEQETREPLIHLLKEALDNVPSITSSFVHLTNEEKHKISEKKDYFFVIASECVKNKILLELFEELIASEGFVVSREKLGSSFENVKLPKNYQMIASYDVEDEMLVILKYNKMTVVSNATIINIKSNDERFEWLEKLKQSMKDTCNKILSSNDKFSGVLGLVNCLRKEPNGHLISCFFIDDDNLPVFDFTHPIYQAQHKKGMSMNVFKNGQWGTYRYLQIKSELNEECNFECNPNMTYIVLGNLDYALNFADKLVLRKCTKLVFNLTTPQTPRHGYRLRVLKANNIEIILVKYDTSTKLGCEKVFGEAAALGAVGGIFNLNNFQSNNLSIGLHSKLFDESLKLKAATYKYLDEVSRDLCPDLKYFVVFSSVTSGRGLPGRSNYGMINAIAERIMEHRQRCGLPAKAIQWSLQSVVGLIADNDIYDIISHTNFLQTIDEFFGVDDPTVSSMSKSL